MLLFFSAVAAGAEPDRGAWIRTAAEQAGCDESLIVGPFFTAEEAAQRKAAAAQSGIGLALRTEGGVCVIRHVYRNSPAAAAGLRRGEIIVAIGGRATAELSENLPFLLLSGPSDTAVALSVKAADGPGREVEIKRGFILQDPKRNEAEVVTGDTADAPAVGVIRLACLDAKLGEEFVRRSMYDLHEKAVAGLVLDVRDCAGGHLGAIIDIAGLFLPPGTALFQQGLTDEKAEKTSTKAGLLCDNKVPLVVLCGAGTEGPAELLVAALQDNKRAAVVGRRTPGNIVSKQAITLPDGRVAYRLLGRYYTPSGRLISGEGVAPEQMLEETLADKDEMAAAIAALLAICQAAR